MEGLDNRAWLGRQHRHGAMLSLLAVEFTRPGFPEAGRYRQQVDRIRDTKQMRPWRLSECSDRLLSVRGMLIPPLVVAQRSIVPGNELLGAVWVLFGPFPTACTLLEFVQPV